MALSVARLGDALGNSILMIIIPLYIARLHVLWFPLPETVERRTGTGQAPEE